jgi:hypothetical protein
VKTESHDPTEPLDKQRYKKKYLLRKLEEQTTEKLLEVYRKLSSKELNDLEDRDTDRQA